MEKNADFNKIQEFINAEYKNLINSGINIIKPITNGYSVNSMSVMFNGNGWAIVDDKKHTLYNLHQLRTSILLALTIDKHQYKKIPMITSLDQHLDMVINDRNFYSNKLKSNSENDVYIDRLSKVESDFEILNLQLNEIEKTLCLP